MTDASPDAFQDLIPNNHCWGCGNLNDGGLQLKSHWTTPGEISTAVWSPQPVHLSGPEDVLNADIPPTPLDCHGPSTPIAHAYRVEGRKIGEGDQIWYATGALNVRFQKPTPIDSPVTLTAIVESSTEKRTNLRLSLESGGIERATAEVIAFRVPASWMTE